MGPPARLRWNLGAARGLRARAAQYAKRFRYREDAGTLPAVTERLYYTDAYLARFDAAVTDRADDGRRVYLDRTAFYPTSGGQPFDTGRLGGVRSGGRRGRGRSHRSSAGGPVEGDRLEGSVDWPRRFDHMQQHTGQHLLSAVVADRFGYDHCERAFRTRELDARSGDRRLHAGHRSSRPRPVRTRQSWRTGRCG